MKYFSFAMDITYNKLNISGGQTIDVDVQGINLGNVVLPNNMYLKGYEVAWTFLFMAHYGFMPDSEVPAGRIHPYIGVGPAILWSGFENPVGNGGANAMNVALVVEPGIRWMALSNVSIDTAMRYRYAVPSYDVGYHDVTLSADAAPVCLPGAGQLPLLSLINFDCFNGGLRAAVFFAALAAQFPPTYAAKLTTVLWSTV